jgi:hypothetical protein
LPILYSPLALLVGLRAAPEDVGREHILRLKLRAPSGGDALPPLSLGINPVGHPRHPDWEAPFPAVITFGGVTFNEAGIHTLEMSLDGEDLPPLRLEVVIAESTPAPAPIRLL